MRSDNEENHPIRKSLQLLRRATASPDFELRLHHRIRAQQNASVKLFFWNSARSPVPAFAYSMLAIVLVGVLAYEIVVNTDISPTSPGSTLSAMRDTARRESSSPTVVNGPESDNQTARTTSSTRENGGVPLEKLARKSPEAPSHESASDINVREEDRVSAGIRPHTQETAREATSEEQSGPVTTAVPQNRMAIDRSKSTTGTLELKIASDSSVLPDDGRRLVDPRLRDALGVGIMNVPVTASLKDSLKADSLKKLQKQILQTKSKGKKPLD